MEFRSFLLTLTNWDDVSTGRPHSFDCGLESVISCRKDSSIFIYYSLSISDSCIELLYVETGGKQSPQSISPQPSPAILVDDFDAALLVLGAV